MIDARELTHDLFKMLVFQKLCILSDEEISFQVDDRRSLEEFVGLGVMNDIPDATTVDFFRERLRKAGVLRNSLRCLRHTCAPRASKLVVARSMTRLSSLFPSNVIPARRTRKSKPEDCRRAEMKTQIASTKTI